MTQAGPRGGVRPGTLWRASHPEPAVLVTAVTTALAAAAGRPASGVVLVAAAVLAGQLSIGWLNDAVDADRDRASGRRDKPVATGEIDRRPVTMAAFVSVALALLLSLPSGLAATAVHGVALAAAWAYDLRLKSTIASGIPYAVAFGLLPSFVTLGLPEPGWAPLWATVGAGLLGVGAHLANVLPDLDDDLATGVRGLPHRLGPRACRAGAALLLLVASVVLVLGPPGPTGPVPLAGLVLVVVVVMVGLSLGRRPGSRAPFRATLLVAAVDVALLVGQGAALT